MLNNELKNNPFKVPENYFDALPGRIQDRHIAKNKKVRFALKPQWAVAGVLGMAVLFSVINTSDTNSIQTNITQNNDPIIRDSANPYDEANVSGQNKSEINEGMINYLALENISIDDILNARF